MIVGYARISTEDQNISSQIDLLKQHGAEKVFSDVASGVREDRMGLKEMLSYVRKGDTILVYKIDRIFRSLKNLVSLIEKFNEQNLKFKSLSEPEFDTTTSNGRFLLQIFGAVAEFERNLISERTKVGLEGARKRRKLLGRPTGFQKATLEKYEYALHLYKNKTIPIEQACKTAKISKSSFYRIENNLKK